MKVALVHDDLIQYGGAERLFEAMCEIWPQAPVYTSTASKVWCNELSKPVGLKRLKTSFMQRLPFKERLYRAYFPLYPLAFESFDFTSFDVVLSSSTRFAHGIITKPETLHICYMNTPPRMFWETGEYYRPGLLKTVLAPFLSYLRLWDKVAATRPDFIVANSKTPQARIKKYYGRESVVIYPFVDLERFAPMSTRLRQGFGGQADLHPTGRAISADGYYLVVSRLTSWKRIDVAIGAFNKLGLPLIIIGEGPDRNRLEKLAGPTVKLLDRLPDRDVVGYYRNCQAFVFPQREDFGITPLEAMAVGKPVIALRAGGALETVVEGKTGEFFYPQTIEALEKVLVSFNPYSYHYGECRKRAEVFSKEVFKRKLRAFVEEKWGNYKRLGAG